MTGKSKKGRFLIPLFATFILLPLISSCKNYKRSTKPETDLLRQTLPLKGCFTIKLEKVLSFYPSRSNPSALRINEVLKDRKGNYYFVSRRRVLFLKYSGNGEFIGNLVKRGEGPGEVRYIYYFTITEDNIYIEGVSKILKFDLDGRLLQERKIERRYIPFDILEGDKILGTFPDISGKERKDSLGLFDREENLLKKYVSTNPIKPIWIRYEDGGLTGIIHPMLIPRLVWSYDRKNKFIYYGISNRYEIFAIDLQGKKLLSFGRTLKGENLSYRDREKIAGRIKIIEKSQKKQLIKKLPDRLMYFTKIKVLPSGYVAVYTPSPDSYYMDIFDRKGRYLYRLKAPSGLHLEKLTVFYDGNLGYMEETSSETVFTEYRVVNPSGIFHGEN